jgi:hypothetical protein
MKNKKILKPIFASRKRKKYIRKKRFSYQLESIYTVLT